MGRLPLAQTHTSDCHHDNDKDGERGRRRRRGIIHKDDDDFIKIPPFVHRSLSCISCKYWLWFKPNSITFSSSSRCFCSGENLTPSSIFRRSSTSNARQEWRKRKSAALIFYSFSKTPFKPNSPLLSSFSPAAQLCK